MSVFDFYKSLGIERSSASDDISGHIDQLLRAPNLSRARYDELTTARRILGDPDKRRVYDQALSDPSAHMGVPELHRLAYAPVNPGGASAPPPGETWAVSPQSVAAAKTESTANSPFNERLDATWEAIVNVFRKYPIPATAVTVVAVVAIVGLGLATGIAISDKGGNGRLGSGGGSGSRSGVTGAADYHRFRVVESIDAPGAAHIRGLEQSMDGTLVASISPEESGQTRVVRFNPADGSMEDIAAVDPPELYDTSADDMPQVAKGFGITQMHPVPELGETKRVRGSVLGLYNGGVASAEIRDGEVTLDEDLNVNIDVNLASVGVCAMPSTQEFRAISQNRDLDAGGTGKMHITFGDGYLGRAQTSYEGLARYAEHTSVRVVVDGDLVTVKDLGQRSDGMEMLTDPAQLVDGSADRSFDLRGVSIDDTAVVGGLGELDCISPEQMKGLADAGIVDRGDADTTRVLAVIDGDLSGAFDRAMAESAENIDVAEFGERVDFALLDPSTGAVTNLYGIDGLQDDAQVSAVAVSVNDPTTMWITLEGDNRIHKLEMEL